MPRLAGLAILAAVIWIVLPADRLGEVLPAEIPDRETLDTWEKIEGETETPDVHVVYHLYTNPRRNGLYEITHYRMTRILRSTDGGAWRVRETEKILWNPPRGRVPEVVRCYERLEAPPSSPGGEQWRRLEPGSAAYRSELSVGMSVYWLHRAASQARARDRE